MHRTSGKDSSDGEPRSEEEGRIWAEARSNVGVVRATFS